MAVYLYIQYAKHYVSKKKKNTVEDEHVVKRKIKQERQKSPSQKPNQVILRKSYLLYQM